MTVNVDIVMLLNFLVDWLLLMGAGRLRGYPLSPGRSALGAILGGLYGGACLLPGFAFLGSTLWRTVMLCLMAAIAYGFQRSAIHSGALFLLLSMALGGVVVGMEKGVLSLAGAAGGLCLLCVLGFWGVASGRRYVPVELTYGDSHLKLTALRDTGNTLRDPVTGSTVLVVDGETAQTLTGLTEHQLRHPVENVRALPGLRLIPYRAVGTENGLLLALKLNHVKIGPWQGSYLVAFAPGSFGGSGEYQALTGGAV